MTVLYNHNLCIHGQANRSAIRKAGIETEELYRMLSGVSSTLWVDACNEVKIFLGSNTVLDSYNVIKKGKMNNKKMK